MPTCLMFVAPPHVSFQYTLTSQQLSKRLHHKQITRLKPAGDGHTAASLLNFMHNLLSSKVSKTLKENVTVHTEGHKDLQLQLVTRNFSEKGSEEQSTQRCNISQKHSDHHDSQTSLQAIVTNNQRLAAQFKGSEPPAC